MSVNELESHPHPSTLHPPPPGSLACPPLSLYDSMLIKATFTFTSTRLNVAAANAATDGSPPHY